MNNYLQIIIYQIAKVLKICIDFEKHEIFYVFMNAKIIKKMSNKHLSKNKWNIFYLF